MDKYRALLDHYVEAYNAGDLDGVMDLYADDATQLMPDGMFMSCVTPVEELNAPSVYE